MDPENTIIANNVENENKKAVESVPSFSHELSFFVAHITSLSATLEISLKAVIDAHNSTVDKYKEFEKENIKFEDNDGQKVMLVKLECFKEFQDFHKKIGAYKLALKNLPRSYVMALISQYDAFLGRLIRVVFLTKPELLNASERNLSFSQLVEFGSIDDAKEFILEKEIESALRKSHSEQFQWMETKFEMPLRKGLDVWPKFIEVTERRNLFVHTGGIVSTQYMKVCKENNVNLTIVKVGDELSVSRRYFTQAYNTIFEVGFKLAHVLWRKFLPNDLENADVNLIGVGYDTLSDEDYLLTKMIFDFAINVLKKYACEENRRIMIVNQALAYKWSGDDSKAKNIIITEDWSATRAKFRLAEAVLLGNYDDAYSLMIEIGKSETEMTKEFYRDWPLFKEIKKEVKFMEVFQEIFGEPYYKVSISEVEMTEKNNSETKKLETIVSVIT